MKTVQLKLELRASKKQLLQNVIWQPVIAIKPIINLSSLQQIDTFTYKSGKYTLRQIVYPWDSTKYVIETDRKVVAYIEYSYPCQLLLPFCVLRVTIGIDTIMPMVLLKRKIENSLYELFAKTGS